MAQWLVGPDDWLFTPAFAYCRRLNSDGGSVSSRRSSNWTSGCRGRASQKDSRPGSDEPGPLLADRHSNQRRMRRSVDLWTRSQCRPLVKMAAHQSRIMLLMRATVPLGAPQRPTSAISAQNRSTSGRRSSRRPRVQLERWTSNFSASLRPACRCKSYTPTYSVLCRILGRSAFS
jgi:hypothetical protein